MDIHDLIIIGSGPAGLTAAIYAARGELKPIVFGGKDFGGQLTTTTEVENFPGFPDGIMGPELMQKMVKQAERFGAEIKYSSIEKVELKGDLKKLWSGGEEFNAKAVIVATGSVPRTLGIPGEKEYWGRGVSTCATCDGAFYRDKVVAVVGGGDSAMEEATFLTKFAKKVYIIHRRDSFRASKIMQAKALANEKIEVLWNTEIRKVQGDQTVKKIKLLNNQNKTEIDLEVDGFFLAIGHVPNTEFLGGQLELDKEGFIIASSNSFTSVEGVFVAGDVEDHHYQQAITAAGSGCKAAMDAERWLETRA